MAGQGTYQVPCLTGEPVMTNTVVHLEAALEDSLPFIYEL